MHKCVCVHVCVLDLHIFHADPLVIGENGPHRHCLNTLLFLWGGGKDGGKSTTKISCLFPLCSVCNVHCKCSVMSLSRGTKHSAHNGNLMCYLNKTTQTSTRSESATDKESKFLLAFPFHCTAILWGCLHIRGLYGLANIPRGFRNMRVCDWRQNQRQFLDLISSPA